MRPASIATGFVVLCSLLLVNLAAPERVAVAQSAQPQLGAYYIAIGDSFSLGYRLPTLPVDAQCVSPDAVGFTCLFYRYLKGLNPSLQFMNFSEGGADSCELAGAGHRCYETSARANPLDAAVAFLTAHPGQVSPITLTIGGNDLLALLPQVVVDPLGTAAKLPAVFKTFAANLDMILARLRSAAGPEARIIVTTQPNPFGGIGSPPLPQGLPDLATNVLKSLNDVIKAEAPKYNAVVIDSAAAFDANPGGAAALTYAPQSLASSGLGGVQIHPTQSGYAVYAAAVIAGAGYTGVPLAAIAAPLRVIARLTVTLTQRGAWESLVGRTGPAVRVAARLRLPGGPVPPVHTISGTNGRFHLRFRVGSRSGRGWVVVSVLDAVGRTAQSRRLTFRVR